MSFRLRRDVPRLVASVLLAGAMVSTAPEASAQVEVPARGSPQLHAPPPLSAQVGTPTMDQVRSCPDDGFQPPAAAPAAGEAGERFELGDETVHQVAHLRVCKETDFGLEWETGSGVVVGHDDDWIYVATARHVVWSTVARSLADSVRIRFHGRGRFVAGEIYRVARSLDGETLPLDLAVVRAPRDTVMADTAYSPRWDRLGDNGRLGPGDEVRAVGCPSRGCWSATPDPDQVVSTNLIEIMFRSSEVSGGSSGGGLVDRWNEVVGLVLRTEGLAVRAYPMDFVLQTLREWEAAPPPGTDPAEAAVAGGETGAEALRSRDGISFIRQASIPRRGYAVTAGLTVLTPPGKGGFPQGRRPSARLTADLDVHEWLSLGVGLLRLAPDGVGPRCPGSPQEADPLSVVVGLRDRKPCEQVVHALVAGIGVPIRWRRLLVRPFGELGVGRVRGRYDIGGAYGTDGLEYTPNFKAVEQTGFGGGSGLTVEFIGLPHAVVQGTVGYWRFQDAFEGAELPDGYVPEPPTFFVGLGLRVGL